MPTDARTIYEEGVVIPPFKLYREGRAQRRRAADHPQPGPQARLEPRGPQRPGRRLPHGVAPGGRDVRPVRHRHLPLGARRAAAAQLRRHEGAAARWCSRRAGRSRFTDYICDDGVGNGPYELKLSLTRTGDKVHLDFTGSSPQAAGPINYYINENLTRMFFGIYMITVADPQILWNDGFYPLVDVTIPDGSYWKPKYPAALSGRNHGIGRVFDLFGGLLGQTNPALLNAAGFSSSPHFMYSGHYSTGRAEGGVVPALLDRLRRHPRPAARRRAGRPLAVALVRQHPLRVPRVVLPAADREVGDRRRHRRRRACTAAATASTSPTSSRSRAPSPSTTTAG